jgi:glycosyltransferase involved in cell wall biosynthesis
VIATKRRLRILFVVDAFPTAAAPTDGIFLRDQVGALVTRADVGVAIGRTCSPRQLLARRRRLSPDAIEEGDGLVIYRNESFVPTTRATRLLVRARCRSIERAVRSFEQRFGRPDVIHAHCAAFAGETAVHVGRSLGMPVVLTDHYSFISEFFEVSGNREKCGARLLDAYEAADAVLAVSRSQARRLRELGVRRRIRCVPNAVDTAVFSFESIAPPADGVWRLLCVARDHDVKDLPTLIEALALLRGLPFEMTIVGSGAYRRARAMSGGPGLGGRVRFAGELWRPELARLMRASHLTLSSSRTETFGMSLAESLCVGRPVVTTDSGGPRDIVRPQDGRIVPVGDAHALAGGIADVLGKYGGFDQAALSASARERFGPAAFAARMLAVYGEVLGCGLADAEADPSGRRGCHDRVESLCCA